MSTVNQLLDAAGLRPREVHNSGITSRIMVIGPAEAKALLAANRDNRALRTSRVKFYARVMRAGEWRTTHQGIAFSTEGVGIDLQHRLSAVIESGIEITLMVVEGLAPEAFQAIDQHERRTMADALRLRRELTEEARLFIYLPTGDTTCTLAYVAEVACLIEASSDALIAECPTRRKVFSSVSVRCAAIMLMMEKPQHSAYVLSAYRDLVLMRTERWTPVMHAFGRQVANGANVNSAGRINLYGRAVVALDPAKAGNSKIQISDTKNLRERVSKLIGKETA